VRELQSRITSREFAEYRAFDSVSPIGGIRGDLQAASIVQAVYACHTAKGKPPMFEECQLKFGEGGGKDPADLEMQAQGWARRWNKQFEDQSDGSDRLPGTGAQDEKQEVQ